MDSFLSFNEKVVIQITILKKNKMPEKTIWQNVNKVYSFHFFEA